MMTVRKAVCLTAAVMFAPVYVSAGPQGDGVTFTGRVVELEKEGGRPISGATVVIARTLPGVQGKDAPGWVGETSLRTDDQGRFTLTFPPEQAAEPRLWVAVARVTHPDYVPRKGHPVPLVTLLQGRKYGDKPFFESLTLERGVEFSGRVVNPDGTPAADVPYEFGNWGSRNNRAPNMANDTTGRTDAEGRFRLRMPTTQSLTVTLMPGRFAPFQRFWGTDTPSKHPDVFAPTDLGDLELKPGPALKGRVLDLQGRPIVGHTVTAYGRMNSLRRSATTDAEGRFTLAPLRPGNYILYGEGQDLYGGVDPGAAGVPVPDRIVRPARVFLEEGAEPEPVVLREMPTVRVEVRFVDSLGKPARGSAVKLGGTIPNAQGQANPVEDEIGMRMRAVSSVNDPEPRLRGDRLDWAFQGSPDAQGRVVFRAPKGLQNANIFTGPLDETVAYKTRLEEGGPLKFWGGGQLGILDADRAGITVVCYRAPTVLVSVTTEDGAVPDEAKLSATFVFNGGSYGGNEVRQADGRFRMLSLMPDHEYELYAMVPGYVPNTLPRVNLPEGATSELTVLLRRKPGPLKVGDLAPPFLVKTIDGRAVGPSEFRGKYLLLHFWFPARRNDAGDLATAKAIHQRFGKDERFAMLGLCLDADPKAAAVAVAAEGIAWPVAVLRDRTADPMAQDYGVDRPPVSILIGPDGKVLAKDLRADAIEKAVADALRRE
jgi:hypothetical protein